MVAQWEDRFYERKRGHTYIGNPATPEEDYPEFSNIVKAYGINSRKITKIEELKPAIEEMINTEGPYVLDIKTPYQEHVLPMIPGGKTYKDIIIE